MLTIGGCSLSFVPVEDVGICSNPEDPEIGAASCLFFCCSAISSCNFCFSKDILNFGFSNATFISVVVLAVEPGAGVFEFVAAGTRLGGSRSGIGVVVFDVDVLGVEHTAELGFEFVMQGDAAVMFEFVAAGTLCDIVVQGVEHGAGVCEFVSAGTV